MIVSNLAADPRLLTAVDFTHAHTHTHTHTLMLYIPFPSSLISLTAFYVINIVLNCILV